MNFIVKMCFAEPDVSPISTPPPSFNWKRDGMPVVAPSNGMPKGLSPRAHSPAEGNAGKFYVCFYNQVLLINNIHKIFSCCSSDTKLPEGLCQCSSTCFSNQVPSTCSVTSPHTFTFNPIL